MKTALIFGSSGLIGNHLLSVILQNNDYNHIKLFVRSESKNNNSKVEIVQTDFTNLEKYKDLIVGDDCFFCIGTTRKNTPDKNEYRRIEYSIPLSVAQIAKFNSVKSFIYVSSLGANSSSSGSYLKNILAPHLLQKPLFALLEDLNHFNVLFFINLIFCSSTFVYAA